jgi:hypothetical protein
MVLIDASQLDKRTIRRVLDEALQRARSLRAPTTASEAEAVERLPVSEEFAAIRALTPPGLQEDSVALIRALRDE